MVALLILIVGGFLAIGTWSWLASRAGAQGPGGRGARSPRRVHPSRVPGLSSAQAITEQREALEAEDLAQMLAAHNAWRRRRGRPERTVEEVELLVAGEARELRRGAEAAAAQRDLDELLQATNARRRARGLPERDRGEVRRRDDPDAPA